MVDKLAEIEKELRFIDKWAKWLIIMLLVLILLLPFFITRTLGFIDFSETGQIGDTIGGITAPIIGFVSAILIFVSFRAQIKANKIQFEIILEDRKNSTNENYFKNIETLISSIEKADEIDLENSFNTLTSSFTEIDNINSKPRYDKDESLSSLLSSIYPSLSHLTYHLSLFIQIKKKLDSAIYMEELDKTFFMATIKLIYLKNFRTELTRLINAYSAYNSKYENSNPPIPLPEELEILVNQYIILLRFITFSLRS